jgi:hypothetical protein
VKAIDLMSVIGHPLKTIERTNFLHTLWILHIVATMQVLGVVCVLSANKRVKGDYYIYYFYISI